MEYEICRASYNDAKAQPCKNAKHGLKKVTYYASMADMKNNVESEKFVGTWYIDINSIEDLNALIDEVGDIIIYPGNKITIYDEFIE